LLASLKKTQKPKAPTRKRRNDTQQKLYRYMDGTIIFFIKIFEPQKYCIAWRKEQKEQIFWMAP
jgi:hypothetical protein